MAKYYAVRNGYKTGIFTSWDSCKAVVYGFSGAEFKSFKTRAEAEEYLRSGAAAKDSSPNLEASPERAAAYVDGSFDARSGRFAYGAVIFHNGAELTMSESFFDEELSQMRNVAGEIMGARAAMQYCLDHGVSSLELYYDYEGIKKWCTGEWKTTKAATAAYRGFYLGLAGKLTVIFNKVKGHSGDKYNDMADALAKEALGLE